MGTKKNGLELYLHIPFCIKKCDYCDFLSGPSTRAGQEAYIYALLREMETVSKNLKKRPVECRWENSQGILPDVFIHDNRMLAERAFYCLRVQRAKVRACTRPWRLPR